MSFTPGDDWDELDEKAEELGKKTAAVLLRLMLGQGRTETISIFNRTYQIEGVHAANSILIFPLDH